MYARYTEVLGDLMKNEHTAAALNKALSTYPLYQGKKVYDLIPTREELNKKLLNHYKQREIGFDTVGRFLDELEITMCEIMPLYNERLKSIEIMADIPNPFDNVDITETIEIERSDTSSSQGSGTTSSTTTAKDTTSNTSSAENSSTSTGESSQETTGNNTSTNSSTNQQTTDTDNTSSKSDTTSQNVNGKQVDADTPQGNVLTIGASGIDNVTHASHAKWDKNTTTGTSETESTDNSTVETSGTTSTTGTDTSESTLTGTDSRTTSETSESSQSGVVDRTASDQSESSNTSQSTSQGITRQTSHRVGGQGVTTYARDMIEFRTSFIDVVNEIINDRRIAELFMLVY